MKGQAAVHFRHGNIYRMMIANMVCRVLGLGSKKEK